MVTRLMSRRYRCFVYVLCSKPSSDHARCHLIGDRTFLCGPCDFLRQATTVARNNNLCNYAELEQRLMSNVRYKNCFVVRQADTGAMDSRAAT